MSQFSCAATGVHDGLQSLLSKLRSFSAPSVTQRAGIRAALRSHQGRIDILTPAEVVYETRRWVEALKLHDARIVVGAPIPTGIDHDAVVLIVNRAIDVDLKDRFFEHPEIHTFVDHYYTTSSTIPELLTIGTTEASLAQLVLHRGAFTEAAPAELGERIYGAGFGEVLHSPRVQKIRLHALGPDGTNIAQACRAYVAARGIAHKTEIVVHPTGVEPRAYAKIAVAELSNEVLPLHMECAVYYDLHNLFAERVDEVVFADHFYMPLDAMQLATRASFTASGTRPLRLASHPSPLRLAGALLDSGEAIHVKATSNAAAAEMVRAGAADMCITTESARARYELVQQFSFGSPTMLFTIGTPAAPALLEQFRAAASFHSLEPSKINGLQPENEGLPQVPEIYPPLQARSEPGQHALQVTPSSVNHRHGTA